MNDMNNGVPDCPDCGGKGMCIEHNCEYLKWVYETARDEYEAALKEQKVMLEEKVAKLEERIKQNEFPSN